METTNIIKNTMEPVDDGGRKYNYIYVVSGIIGGIVGIMCAGIGILFFLPLGLCVGWLIKNKILDLKALQFRKYTFKCDNQLPFSELMQRIIPELTSMGMTVELNSDNSPMITHNNIIYDFMYNDDMTFSIWWRKSLARGLLVINSIKMYRNISVDMGIISYVIQKNTNSVETVSEGGIKSQTISDSRVNEINHSSADYQNKNIVNEAMQSSANVDAQTESFKFCPNCGTRYMVGTKFCQNCGMKL